MLSQEAHSPRAMSQLSQGLLWFAEKTIHQTTKQWTLAPKTIELRDTKVQCNWRLLRAAGLLLAYAVFSGALQIINYKVNKK